MESKKKPHKKEVYCDFHHWLRLWPLLGHRRSYWKWNAAYFFSRNGFNVFLITDEGQSAAVVELYVLAEANKWLNKVELVDRLYIFYICSLVMNVDTGVMRPLRTFWHKDSGKGVSWHAHKLRQLIIKWLNERNAESGWKFRRVWEVSLCADRTLSLWHDAISQYLKLKMSKGESFTYIYHFFILIFLTSTVDICIVELRVVRAGG